MTWASITKWRPYTSFIIMAFCTNWCHIRNYVDPIHEVLMQWQHLVDQMLFPIMYNSLEPNDTFEGGVGDRGGTVNYQSRFMNMSLS